MKLVYTEQAIISLQECLDFLPPETSDEKRIKIREQILNKADKLTSNPKLGQREEYLYAIENEYRRIIISKYKILYRIEKDTIFITDIFDSRQNPEKMKI